MSTAENAEPAPRQSILAKTADRVGAHRVSPENTRQSFMLLIALIATGLSGYFTVHLDGVSPTRILMTVLCAGWFSMVVHTARSAMSARRS